MKTTPWAWAVVIRRAASLGRTEMDGVESNQRQADDECMERGPLDIPAPVPSDVATGPEVRRAGRMRPARLTCDLGRVVDISAQGLRCRCRGKPAFGVGAVFAMMIHAPAGLIRVASCVVWKRKIAWRRWELGIRFVDVSAETRLSLNLLARGIAAECDLSHQTDDDLM